MKVIVTLEIEVDRGRWTEEYDVENNANAIRKDVREYAAESLHQLCQENNGASVTLRPNY